MAEVLTGKCTDAQIAALLIALAHEGRDGRGDCRVSRRRSGRRPRRCRLSARAKLWQSAEPAVTLCWMSLKTIALIDTSGTGGDASGTFNISTATALVTAGAGVRVAKHGNRSISSKCGSADVIEALGVNIQLSPERAAQCLREVGICFLYAPNLHPAMKQVQGVRRELRMRTMFNLLGPLTNPARANGQVVGVYSLELVEKLAEALSMLGLRRALGSTRTGWTG